jgi:hypothetical protein
MQCRCVPPPPPKEAVQNSDLVFIGSVVKINKIADNQLAVLFKVNNVIKGDSLSNVVIRTAASSASCGYNFVKNSMYIVYATKGENRIYHTHTCTRTSLLEHATQDVEELGIEI